uniref:hypothetical protein n=1 Tax=Acinetobacter baumannii TaxID=470 RepID=UPI003391599A
VLVCILANVGIPVALLYDYVFFGTWSSLLICPSVAYLLPLSWCPMEGAVLGDPEDGRSVME